MSLPLGTPRLQPRVSHRLRRQVIARLQPAGVCLSKTTLALVAAIACSLAGCHHKPPQVSHQAPPPITRRSASQPSTAPTRPSAPPTLDDTSGPPIYTETGLASWYGPNYNRRAAADGTVYDQDGMTAAHRTLPMGSTVRVTNLATGQQVYVRITDRGPFAPGRILDLSEGAAKAIGLYRAGVGKVRVEAFAHTSADPPGRWCVQTGPFTKEHDARDLKTALLDRYRTAQGRRIPGPHRLLGPHRPRRPRPRRRPRHPGLDRQPRPLRRPLPRPHRLIRLRGNATCARPNRRHPEP